MNQESLIKEEELSLLFIDEKRNKSLEKRFNSYINKYSNFEKKDKPDTLEKLDYYKKNKIQPKIINVTMN